MLHIPGPHFHPDRDTFQLPVVVTPPWRLHIVAVNLHTAFKFVDSIQVDRTGSNGEICLGMTLHKKMLLTGDRLSDA